MFCAMAVMDCMAQNQALSPRSLGWESTWKKYTVNELCLVQTSTAHALPSTKFLVAVPFGSANHNPAKLSNVTGTITAAFAKNQVNDLILSYSCCAWIACLADHNHNSITGRGSSHMSRWGHG